MKTIRFISFLLFVAFLPACDKNDGKNDYKNDVSDGNIVIAEVVELEEIVGFDQALCKWTLLAEPPFVERGVRDGTIPRQEVEAWRSSL